MKKFSLGFSPCPNDTFIFDALVHHKIDTKGYHFEYLLEDVEALNQKALSHSLDITKLSFGTYLHLSHSYRLLNAGSALGKGVGPLLVSKTEIPFNKIEKHTIAIPGFNTTANLLLSMAAPKAQNKQCFLFSEIENVVLNNQVDIGLIIHENRFTYQDKGLKKIIDLGDWWEQQFNAAIPLGGIVIKKEYPIEIKQDIEQLIKESIDYAWQHYPSLSPFVEQHAQEMSQEVMRKHIELYVNEFSSSLGNIGKHSILQFFNQAYKVGLTDKQVSEQELF